MIQEALVSLDRHDLQHHSSGIQTEEDDAVDVVERRILRRGLAGDVFGGSHDVAAALLADAVRRG